MADNLPDTIENALLDALVGTTPWTVTTPIMLRLYTATGTDAAEGTEVTGGTYTRQQITFGGASGGAISNNSVLNSTLMPACTVNGIELWSSDGTPKRLAYGNLSSPKTVAAGDTLQFASSSITLSLA
jgi:hypothetical protein